MGGDNLIPTFFLDNCGYIKVKKVDESEVIENCIISLIKM